MKKQVLLFDLDGTITDSAEGICNSIAAAFDAFGLSYTPALLRKFIGPPLTWSFPHFCGFDEEQTTQAIAHFHKRYREGGIYENRLYPGIEEMLSTLIKAGFRLGIATSKPDYFAVQVIEYFDLGKYFEHVLGSRRGEEGTKADVVRDALAAFDVAPDAVWMIGDREHDIEGAREAGVEAIGALWGYGSKEEFEAHHAAHMVENPEKLIAFLVQ